MDLMTAVKTCFGKYATFSGRARRSEYWWFVLFNVLVNFALGIVDGVLFGFHGDAAPQVLSGLYALVILLPSLAVAVRRLHDLGRSGWWLLIWLIPLIGWIILIWWFATKGEDGPNGYGPDPLSGDGYGPSSLPRVPRQ